MTENPHNKAVRRAPFRDVVAQVLATASFSQFTPAVIGTPPLGIDVASSDIDIACFSPNLSAFLGFCRDAFGAMPGMYRQCVPVGGVPTALVRFRHAGWPVELFCQPLPCIHQYGVRHFNTEKRLLELVPDLRDKVRALKQAGVKTEPAFAQVLGLDGDPYEALLTLEPMTDTALEAMARTAV